MSFYRVFAVALLLLAHAGLHAQTWPSRPLKLVVPFPPGGTGDLLGRLAAKEVLAALLAVMLLPKRWQTVIRWSCPMWHRTPLVRLCIPKCPTTQLKTSLTLA
jgi:hypothetical protein